MHIYIYIYIRKEGEIIRLKFCPFKEKMERLAVRGNMIIFIGSLVITGLLDDTCVFLTFSIVKGLTYPLSTKNLEMLNKSIFVFSFSIT